MEVIKKYLHKNAHLTKASGILILALFVFGVLVPFDFADALLGISLDVIGTGIVLSIISGVLSFLVPVAAFLTGMAGSLLYAAINMDMFYTRCTVDPCFIDVGWNFTRDLVNMALIIGLVAIAFFTIIGNQSHGAGKTLIPFIAVAILVNFSQVFVGVVVDLSNVVMGLFVSTIPTLTDISALWKLSGTSLLGDGSLNTNIAFAGLLKIIASIIYFIGLAFIFFLYSIIFLVRFMVISLLTIMAPLALAAWIFPATKKIFNMWRDQLVQWSFIGIPVLFFLWISLLAMAQFRSLDSPGAALGASGTEGFFADIFPSILLLMLLYVAFAFGMKSGAMGSSMIISQTKKLTKAAGGAARGWAAKSAAKSRIGTVAQRRLEGLAGGKMARIPGVRGAAQFGSQKIREAERSKEAQEAATRMSDAMLTAQLKTSRNSTQFKALFDEKIKRGDGKDIDGLREDKKFDSRMSAHVKNLSLRNQAGTILEAYPENIPVSRNVKPLDEEGQKERKRLLSMRKTDGTWRTDEEAKKEAEIFQHNNYLTKEKAQKISDSSLANPNVIAGLQKNKAVDILSDMATSTKRQANIITGFIAKNNGNKDAAYKELAGEIKQGNVRNAGILLETKEFRKAFAALPQQMTRGIIMGLSNLGQPDDLEKLFTEIHDGIGKDSSGNDIRNHLSFNKIFADTQIKAVIEVTAPKLAERHEAEGGGGAAGGGGGAGVSPGYSSTEAEFNALLRNLRGET